MIPDESGRRKVALFDVAKLVAACGALVTRWDEFMADDGCVNPLDYPFDEDVETIRCLLAPSVVREVL